MKYQTYPNYKPSGVEWLGDVPEHWKVAGFKKYLNEIVDYRGKTPEKHDSGIFLVTARNIKNGKIDYDASQEFIAEADYAEVMSRGKPKIGDLLFTTEAPLGEVASVDREDIALAQRIIKFDGQLGVLNNFYLKYLIISSQFQQSLMMFASGSTALGIKAERFVYLRSLIPPLSEQQKIANFLDHETAKIDTLIDKQQRLIALLKEKRQAVISHAVTKGLNPNAPMKPSGVEWLGDVPVGWVVSTLKYQVNTVNGFGFSSSDVCEEGIPFIRAGNIKNKTITPTDLFLPLHIVERYKRVILFEGDIVISMVGSDPKISESAVGQIGIVPDSMTGAVPNQNVVILREDENSISKKFLFYFLCSTAYRNHLNVFSHNLANQSIISSSLLISSKFMLPSKMEQQEIVKFLDGRLKKIDDTVGCSYKSLNLLNERRTALISAAVTGKIDVRDWGD